MQTSKIKVIDLFSGVGGFRLGLEGWKGLSPTSKYRDKLSNKIPFEIIFSNQWEPATKIQHANYIYHSKFGVSGHFDEPIQNITAELMEIKCDLLVGGFPCPDFSVGALLKYSKGLKGKKGELWFQITRLIKELKDFNRQPDYLLFENVDRMLSSPVSNPGKDFETILQSLFDLDYNVEWKVINASDYGFPQKRKRVFMFCFHKKSILRDYFKHFSEEEIILNKGVISSSFPCTLSPSNLELNLDSKKCQKYKNSGVMYDGKISDYKTYPKFIGKKLLLKDIIFRGQIDDDYYLSSGEIKKWSYIKGPKKIPRTRNGFEYIWSEGAIPFPDDINSPSRTIITSEGGRTPMRTKHVIIDKSGSYRRLMPIELERLNMFPDNFTENKNISNSKRAYLMGNALVVGIVEKIGKNLSKLIYDLS